MTKEEAIEVIKAKTYAAHLLMTEVMGLLKSEGVSETTVGDLGFNVYDHDSIHESMKHFDKPAYTYFKPEDRPVLCDRKMFEAAAPQVQLASVIEEAYVLALERSQIPHQGVWTPERSFKYALMKVCTSITSGWWREFAWEHHDEVLELYKHENSHNTYVHRFWRAVERGVVVKHGST